MKKITPIAMLCNKEQFEAIKPKLKGIEIGCVSNFNEWNYLVNNADGDPFVVCNTGKSGSKRYSREIHETWNERIFLEACGVGTEETFEITKEQILELSKESSFTNATLNKWFPEVFEVKKQNGWYKDNTEPKWLGFFIEDELCYGFNICGDYFINKKPDLDTEKTNDIPATEQEVFEALKNEAVKRYNDGEYVKRFNNSSLLKVDSEFKSEIKNGDLWYGGGVVFREGAWSTIIPTKTKEEAEKLLNCKIID